MPESKEEKAERIVHINLAKSHLNKDVDAILQLTVNKEGSEVVIYGAPLRIAAALATSKRNEDPLLGDVLFIAGETIRMIRYEEKTIEQCIEYWKDSLPFWGISENT